MMEEKIAVAEERLAVAHKTADDPKLATQAAKLAQAYKDLDAARRDVEKLYERWAELEQKQNQT